MAEEYTVTAKHLGNQIKMARKMAHKSQKELGKECGVSETMVGLWERGRAIPRGAFVANVLSKYGVEFEKKEEVKMEAATTTAKEETPKEAKKTFGQALREARLKENMRLLDVGEVLLSDTDLKGPSMVNRISRFEADDRVPTKDEYEKLNDLFGGILPKPDHFCSDPRVGRRRKVTTPAPILAPVEKVEKVKAEEVEVDITERRAKIDQVFVDNVKKICGTRDKEAMLCKKIGLVPGYFYREEYDRSPITLNLFLKVKEALQCDYADLIKDPEEEKLRQEKAFYEKKLREIEERLNLTRGGN